MMNTFKSFKPFKSFNPHLFPPPRRGGGGMGPEAATSESGGAKRLNVLSGATRLNGALAIERSTSAQAGHGETVETLNSKKMFE